MPQSDIAIRLSVQDASTVTRALEQVGDQGQAALKRLTDLGINDAFNQQVAALKAQIDPLGTAQARLNAELAQYDEFARRGAISAEELAQAQALAQERFNATAASVTKYGSSTGQASFAVRNLSFQLNDMVTGLASGQQPLRILAQQGGQIVQAFQMSGVGVGGVLRQAAQSVLGFINPVTLVGTAVAATIGTIIAAYVSYSHAQDDFEESLKGLGRASGATVGDLEGIAEQAAKSGTVTVGAARDIETALIKTGKVGVENLSGLIDFTRRYADLTGGDLKNAIKDVASLMADPAKAAEKLADKFGNLNDIQIQHIETLIKEGHQQEAIKELMEDGLPAVEHQASTWERLKDAVSGYFAELGKNASKGTLQDQATVAAQHVAVLEDRLKSLQDLKTGVDRGDSNAIARSFLEFGVSGPAAAIRDVQLQISEASAELARLQEQVAIDRNYTDAVARGTKENEASRTAGETARKINGPDTLTDLNQQLKDLEGGKGLLTDQKALADAIDRVKSAISSYVPAVDKARQMEELRARSLQQNLTPAQQADIAAEEKRLELAGQKIPEAQRQAEIAGARREALIKATTAASKDAARAEEERQQFIEGIQKALDSSAAAEQRYHDAVQRDVDALTKQADTAEYNNKVKILEAQGTDDAKRAIIQLTEARALDNLAAEESADIAKVLREAKEANVEVDQKQIDAIHAAYARLRQDAKDTADSGYLKLATERQKAGFRELEQFGTRAFDRIGEAVTDMSVQGGDALKDLGNIGKGVISELTQEFIKLAAINPLLNLIPGSDHRTTIGDVIGSLIGGTHVSFGGSSEPAGLSAALGSNFSGDIFGGGFAGGGNVYPGMSYEVGEDGPEKFEPKVPGRIVPNTSRGGQAPNIPISLVVNNKGAPVDGRASMRQGPDGAEIVLDLIAGDIAGGGRTAVAISQRFNVSGQLVSR